MKDHKNWKKIKVVRIVTKCAEKNMTLQQYSAKTEEFIDLEVWLS